MLGKREESDIPTNLQTEKQRHRQTARQIERHKGRDGESERRGDKNREGREITDLINTQYFLFF